MMTPTLTLREFLAQLSECGLSAEPSPDLTHAVIRGEHADFALAACHREGTRLILDLGNKLEE